MNSINKMPVTARRALEIMGLFFLGWIIVLGHSILAPLLLAFFISIMMLPLYRFLQDLRIPDIMAIIISLLVLIVLNAASYGLYLVLVKPLMQKYNAFTIVSRIFAVGAFIVVPFGWQQVVAPDYSSFPSDIWWAIVFMVLAVTIIAYLFNTWALRYANPSLVGAYIYLQPLMAIFVAIGFGKDVFTLQKGIYALLIFTGVYLVSRTRQNVGTGD